MDHLFELIQGLSSYTLGGRCRVEKFRMRFLQSLQLCIHPVIFIIRNLGRIVHVIKLCVVKQLSAKLADSLFNAHRCHLETPFCPLEVHLFEHRSKTSKSMLAYILLYQKNANLSIPFFFFSTNFFDILTKNK